MVSEIIPARGVLRCARPVFQGQIIIDPEHSPGTWQMDRFREDPGFRTPLPVHHHANEQFYVLGGVHSIQSNGAWDDLTTGELALAPRGTPNAQGNTGAQPVHFLGSGNSAGFGRLVSRYRGPREPPRALRSTLPRRASKNLRTVRHRVPRGRP